MNDKTLLYVGLAVVAVLLLKNKSNAGTGSLAGPNVGVQTNPASRNPATGIGNAPNSKSNAITDAVNLATNVWNTATGAIAGLGKGSTPGATVGVATNKSPTTGTGNPSFDAQDAIEAAQGVTTDEVNAQFLDGVDPANIAYN